MEKLIFNEKLYVEELLRIHDITQCDISVFKLIHYLAIYYHQVYGITDKYKLAEMINQELQGFNIFEYYYEKYYKTIDDIVKNVIKNDMKFKEAYKIPIYQNEYDIIQSCGDKKHQKLLFTLYVMARWNNTETGWTSSKSKLSHIKKSANLYGSVNDMMYIIHDLIVDGYIMNTKKAGLFRFHMLNFNTDKNEPVAIEVDSFNNLGNIFLASKDNTYIVCKSCGKLVKKTNNKMVYCKKCANERHKEQNKIIQQNKRKS